MSLANQLISSAGRQVMGSACRQWNPSPGATLNFYWNLVAGFKYMDGWGPLDAGYNLDSSNPFLCYSTLTLGSYAVDPSGFSPTIADSEGGTCSCDWSGLTGMNGVTEVGTALPGNPTDPAGTKQYASGFYGYLSWNAILPSSITSPASATIDTGTSVTLSNLVAPNLPAAAAACETLDPILSATPGGQTFWCIPIDEFGPFVPTGFGAGAGYPLESFVQTSDGHMVFGSSGSDLVPGAISRPLPAPTGTPTAPGMVAGNPFALAPPLGAFRVVQIGNYEAGAPNPNATASVWGVYSGWYNNLPINGGPNADGSGQDATHCAVIAGAAGAAGTHGGYTSAEIACLTAMYGSATGGGYCAAFIVFQRGAFCPVKSCFVWFGEVLFDIRGAPATVLGGVTASAGIVHYRLFGWCKAGTWYRMPDAALKPNGPSAGWENSADIVYLFAGCTPLDFVAANPGWKAVPLPES
jgi:hypothetical protein